MALFRPDRGVAAGAAGRRNHRASCRHPASARAFRDRCLRRAQHAVGSGQFVAERLGPLAGCLALPAPRCRNAASAASARNWRRARRWRRGLGRRRGRTRRGLGHRHAGGRHQHTRDRNSARFIAMQGKRLRAAEFPVRLSHFYARRKRRSFRICGNGSAKNAPSAASAAARSS